MTTEALAIIVISVIGLLLLADFAWKKWYFSNSEPIDAEVLAVKSRTSRDRERDRGKGGASFSVKIQYEIADGSTVTTHIRVRDSYRAKLPESIFEAAGEMNMAKIKNRFQEAAEISAKMSAEGRSKDEIKQAVEDLSRQRVNAIKSKTEELGVARDWTAISVPTTIPVIVSKKNNSKAMLYSKGLSSTRR